jgi:3-hydroxy acid dehydrogenase/malonic semialdehyde reductase
MIVIVTGATAGYGEAIARRFLHSGAKVVACGRRKHKLDELEQEFNGSVCGIAIDVTDRNEVEQKLSNLPPDFSQPDVLVNNAGLALGTQRAQSANLDDWETVVDTNIKGLLYCTAAVLPGMVKRNRGHIVNMGSVAGEYAYPGGNVYGSSKAFVHHFSTNLKADLIGTAIRVTNIEPGLSGGTEFSKIRFKGDQAKADAVYEGTDPLTADDIAQAVYWVCNLPAHVNINYISMMPVCQAPAPLVIDRKQLVKQ